MYYNLIAHKVIFLGNAWKCDESFLLEGVMRTNIFDNDGYFGCLGCLC